MDEQLRNAVDTALKQEQDGIDFYTQAAARCPSEAGKRMFESFAGDERRHLKWVGHMAEGLGVEPGDAPMPRETIRTVFTEAAGRLDEYARASQEEKDAIAIALDMETASYNNYKAAAAQAADARVKDVFERLASEENEHYGMLENTLDYLNSNDQWFLFTEGALLEGDMAPPQG